MQTGHGRQADIWSVGCTVLEMLTGRPPWSKFDTITAALYHIAHTNNMPAVPSDASIATSVFVHACLQRNPRRRPNATRLLAYEFVSVDSKPSTQPNTPDIIPGKHYSEELKRTSSNIAEPCSSINYRPKQAGIEITEFGSNTRDNSTKIEIKEIENKKGGQKSGLSDRRGFPKLAPLVQHQKPPLVVKKPGSAGNVVSVNPLPKEAACRENLMENKPAVPWGSCKDDEEDSNSEQEVQPTMVIETEKKPQSSAPPIDDILLRDFETQESADKGGKRRRIPSCSSSSGSNHVQTSNVPPYPTSRHLPRADSCSAPPGSQIGPSPHEKKSSFIPILNPKAGLRNCERQSKHPATREMIKVLDSFNWTAVK